MALGKKQLEQLSGFTATAMNYGLASFIGLIYLTDWKAVVTYIPYYNKAFASDPKKSC